MEFRTSIQLYKHFNDVHTSVTTNSTNGKTGGNSNICFVINERSQNNTVVQGNFKTDFKANCNVNDYDDKNDDRSLLPLTRIKEESRD